MRKKFRKLLLAFAVIAAAGVALGVAGKMILEAQLPGIVARRIEAGTPFKADVGGASLAWPGLVTLTDVKLVRKEDSSEAVFIKRIEAAVTLGASIQSLTVDGVQASLRESDLNAMEKAPPRKPVDYPIRVRGLSATLLGGAGQGQPLFSASGMSLAFQPQDPGALTVEGVGESPMLGRFRVSGILGGKWIDSRVNVWASEVTLDQRLGELLPATAAEMWKKLAPSGRAALSAEVSWWIREPDARKNLELKWRAALTGVSVHIPGLPEPVTPLSAVVEGNGRTFRVSDGTARYRSALVTFRADSLPVDQGLSIMVQAVARDVEPTEALFALLPKSAAAVLANMHVQGGRVDGDVELGLLFDPNAPVEKRLRIELMRANVNVRKVSTQTKWFPYRVDNIVGSMTIGLDEMVITSPLIGSHADSAVSVMGTFGLSRKSTTSEFVVQSDGVRIDPDLDAAIAGTTDEIHRIWSDCAMTAGKVGAVFRWKGPLRKGDTPPDWSLQLSFAGASGSYRQFPYQLTGMTGRVDIDPQKVSVQGLSGWHGSTAVDIAGSIDLSPGRKDLNLGIRASDLKLDSDFARALDAESQETWNKYQPAGTSDVEVLLTTPTREASRFDIRIAAVMKGVAARIPVGGKWLPLTELTGRAEHFGDVFRLSGITARTLGGQISGDGLVVRAGPLTKVNANVFAQNLSIAEAVSLLPPQAAEQVQPLAPGGRFDVPNLGIGLILNHGEKPDVQYQGVLALRDASVTIPMSGDGDGSSPLNLSEINGRLTLQSQRGRELDGTFELSKVRLLRGTLSNVVGRITKTGPVFRLDDVRGEIYGGQIEASFSGATGLLFFDGQARVTGIDVARLAREANLTGARVWGDLRAVLSLSGERVDKPGESPTWRLGGNGAIHIDRANLGSTPLVRSIFSYKALVLGEGPVVEAADVDFELSSTKLIVDRLVLGGPALSTRAVGWIEYVDQKRISLYFYRKAKGSLLPNLPLIDLVGQGLNWVVDRIQNEVVVMHLGGTLQHPLVEPVVLRNLSDQFKRYILLNMWEEESAKPEEKE